MRSRILMASLIVLAVLPVLLTASVPFLTSHVTSSVVQDTDDSGVAYCNQEAPTRGFFQYANACLGDPGPEDQPPAV